jgi:NAD(P)H-flavin reductase
MTVSNTHVPAGVMSPMVPSLATITSVSKETADTATFKLRVAGRESFSFEPGQFNMLYAFGVGEAAISISGDPDDPGTLVHTVRAVGSVTDALLRMKRGDTIGVRGPYGSAWPLDRAKGRDVVIVTGGIGLAPLRPAIYQLLDRRSEFDHVSVLYGARSSTEMLYRRELERWRGRFDVDFQATVDRGGPGWNGDVGVVTSLIPRARFDPIDTVAFVCGPEIMMRFTVRELLARGVPADAIYVSMERNMRCGIGFCGHCQYGPEFVCKDGPVFRFDQVARLFSIREV